MDITMWNHNRINCNYSSRGNDNRNNSNRHNSNRFYIIELVIE